jgi:hypothetical protein
LSNDFLPSSICRGVSNKFTQTKLYDKLEDTVISDDLEPEVRSLTTINANTLCNLMKKYQRQKGYTLTQLGIK